MCLGIDVSKATIDCCLIKDGIFFERKFGNDCAGYGRLKQWLIENGASEKLHCCCEATGNYYEPMAEYILGQGYKISVENPRKIKGFGVAVLQRSKTDKQDAKLIAQYCKAMDPPLWRPLTQEQRQLQELTRYISRLKRLRAAEQNKRQVAPDYLQGHIQKTIDNLTSQIQQVRADLKAFYSANPQYSENRKRLKTITGIGENAAAVLLATITARFSTAAQLVAYFGLDPKKHQSGTSVNGKERISKVGKSDLRAALYMPAIVAYRVGAFPAFVGRLESKGKPPKLIIVAIMRKLLTIAFHILKNQTEYDKSRYKITT